MRTVDIGGRRSWWHLNRTAFFAIDYLLLWLAVRVAFHLSPRLDQAIAQRLWLPDKMFMASYGLPLAITIGLQLAGLQVNQAGFRGAETLTRILVGSVAGTLCFVALQALVGYALIGRYILGFTLLQGVVFVLFSRWVIWRLAAKESREVFVLGEEAAYNELVHRVAVHRLPIRLRGRASWRSTSAASSDESTPTDLKARVAVTENPASELVVEYPDALALADRQSLLTLMAQGVRVIDLGYFYESEFEMVHVDGLRESWFWGYDPAHARPVYFAFKRLTDIIMSLVGLLLSAPVMAMVALGIVLQDRGPILYSQTRVGLRNRTFRLYKFRTMRIDAERSGPRWAAENDERATRVGQVLRKTRLDEIPQFWNILRGEMSFIGPRPERPEMIEQLEVKLPYYRFRHIVKPGLTGWAQVNYGYGASIEDAREKLAYDLYYIKYGTITRELHIALRTIVAMVRGAR
jgi:exopolysaccharide biosynthesis polyprenyl glycosylphosphotransferase